MRLRLFILAALLPLGLRVGYAQSTIYPHQDIPGIVSPPVDNMTTESPDPVLDPDATEPVPTAPVVKKDAAREIQQGAAIQKEFENTYHDIAYPLISTGIAQNFTIIHGSIPTSALVGTATNDSALAGYVGQYLSTATLVSAVNFGTSDQYRDLGTLVLTPGDWDISLFLEGVAGGATCTSIDAGIGTTAGNSSAGLFDGDNYGWQIGPTAAYASTVSVPAWRKSLSATTTYYFKYRASFSAGTPVAVGRMSARRIR